MQILLGVFVCLLLATSGNTLECEVCSSFGTRCTGHSLTCDAGQDTCVITVTENSLVGETIQTIAKSCGSSSVCRQGPKYMNFGQGKKIRSSTICCVGDACRTAVPQIPPSITETNGKQCPSCYVTSSNSCNDGETVDCAGPENSCFDLAMTVAHGTFVVNAAQKGCATKSVCDDLRRGVTEVQGVRTIVTKAECKAASS